MDRRLFALREATPRFLVVVAYGIAMAYVEAATVLYLRTIYGGIDPAGPRNTPFTAPPDLGWVEIGREAATIVMLATVGWLAGRGGVGRFGAFVVAFGAWDIFYYVFLRLFTGWPPSLFSPDILFLIPLPWWGPVLSPMLIALLMVVLGGLAMARELSRVPWPVADRRAWTIACVGALICLIAFMIDAIAVLPRGLSAAFSVQGGEFPWLLFLVGVALGVLGIGRLLTRAAEDTLGSAAQHEETVGSEAGRVATR